MPEERLSTLQAAEFLGVSEKTVRNLADRGKITKRTAPVGVGRGGQRVYFLKSELAELKAAMMPVTSSRRGK